MKKVFVSGAFNVLHAGHIRFFEDARALGDYLVVSYPPADLLWKIYDKKSVLEDADKMAVISALSMVDEVVLSTDEDAALSFKSAFAAVQPQVFSFYLSFHQRHPPEGIPGSSQGWTPADDRG